MKHMSPLSRLKPRGLTRSVSHHYSVCFDLMKQGYINSHNKKGSRWQMSLSLPLPSSFVKFAKRMVMMCWPASTAITSSGSLQLNQRLLIIDPTKAVKQLLQQTLSGTQTAGHQTTLQGIQTPFRHSTRKNPNDPSP